LRPEDKGSCYVNSSLARLLPSAVVGSSERFRGPIPINVLLHTSSLSSTTLQLFNLLTHRIRDPAPSPPCPPKNPSSRPQHRTPSQHSPSFAPPPPPPPPPPAHLNTSTALQKRRNRIHSPAPLPIISNALPIAPSYKHTQRLAIPDADFRSARPPILPPPNHSKHPYADSVATTRVKTCPYFVAMRAPSSRINESIFLPPDVPLTASSRGDLQRQPHPTATIPSFRKLLLFVTTQSDCACSLSPWAALQREGA
jgi:hypothetical protein